MLLYQLVCPLISMRTTFSTANLMQKKKALRIRPALFEGINHFDCILPQNEANFHTYPLVSHGGKTFTKGKARARKENPSNEGSTDEVEFEPGNHPLHIKIKEDKEML
jgi:hypothetical protein